MKKSLGVGTLALTLWGCSGAQNPTGPDATPTPTPGEELALSGDWAAQVINAQQFVGPLGTETVILTMLARVTMDHPAGGTEIAATTEVCGIEFSEYAGNQTIYPDAAVQAIPKASGTSYLSDTKTGATFTSDPAPRLIGWDATSDPMTEALPEDASDPRVGDHDNDGNPGVTVRIEGQLVQGNVYIVNRSILSFDGEVTGKDRIEGDSLTEQKQNIVGSDNPILALGSVDATPEPEGSSFVMVRMPGGGTCGEVKSTSF